MEPTQPESTPRPTPSVPQARCALIRVNGLASFQNGASLKRFCSAMLEQGCRQIVLDMTACTGMDSTFMGIIAGVALRLKRSDPPGTIHLINLTEKTVSLIRTLGLHRVVALHRAEDVTPQMRALLAQLAPESSMDTAAEAAEAANTRTMLDAHLDLVTISPENQAVFRDVLDCLRDDLRRENTAGTERPAPGAQPG